MQRLIQGLHKFQNKIFGTQKELFERLAKGQSPETLFITCSDSRMDPCLLTQTAPGELFIMRNAGNLVPPYGASQDGEAVTTTGCVRRFFVAASLGIGVFLLSVAAGPASARDDGCHAYDETSGLQCFNCMERVQSEKGWKLVNTCTRPDSRQPTRQGEEG